MAKKTSKPIKEATHEDEQLLMDVRNNNATKVMVGGHAYSVKWMHAGTISWMTSLMTKDGNDDKVVSQCAALIVLNGFWKSHLFYWFLWRWFYYIKQYTSEELMPLIETAQKKTQSQVATSYLNATILLTVLKDTKKQMTKAEAERTLAELRMGNGGKSPKSTESQQPQSSSSESPSLG